MALQSTGVQTELKLTVLPRVCGRRRNVGGTNQIAAGRDAHVVRYSCYPDVRKASSRSVNLAAILRLRKHSAQQAHRPNSLPPVAIG